jgi:hypothetical protein
MMARWQGISAGAVYDLLISCFGIGVCQEHTLRVLGDSGSHPEGEGEEEKRKRRKGEQEMKKP